MSVTVSVSSARASLPELLDRVTAGEEVTLTRHGMPVGVIVRPDALRLRRADAAFDAAQDLAVMLDQAGSSPLPNAGITTRRAKELVAEVDRSRSGAL